MPVVEGIDSDRLLAVIREHYRLAWHGIHGIGHWQRVLQLGLALAERTGADRKVVVAFALVHDARRYSDSSDPGHGHRAGTLARRMNPGFLNLDKPQLELLVKACEYHTRGRTTKDPTIGTCWDADRLDLTRLGIVLDTDLLSTEAARSDEMVNWAWHLSEAEREKTDFKIKWNNN